MSTTPKPPTRIRHVFAMLAGVALACVLAALCAMTAEMAYLGTVGLSVAGAFLLGIAAFAGMTYMATHARSTALAAAGTSILLAVLAYCLPAGISVVSPIATELVYSGMAPIFAGLMTGGAAAIRGAMQRGRQEARHSAALSAHDTKVGVTPSAPPSRRRDHVLSFVVTLLCVVLMAWLTVPFNAIDVTISATVYWITVALVALAALVLARFTELSSMGARSVGILLVIYGIPAFLVMTWPSLPGGLFIVRHLSGYLSAATPVCTGILICAVGMAAHTARRHGRYLESLSQSAGSDLSTP